MERSTILHFFHTISPDPITITLAWKRLAARPYFLATICFSLLFLSLTFPYWYNGEVVCPTRLHNLMGNATPAESSRLENPFFGDFPTGYLPSVVEDFAASSNALLPPSWSDTNELGRPLVKISAFNQTYFPTWVLSIFVNDPFKVLTIIPLTLCWVAGAFFILICRDSGLRPFAAFAGGTLWGTSPLFLFWLTFPMFLASFCWATGTFWAMGRMRDRPDLSSWTLLTFCIYSLIQGGYPQSTLLFGYTIVIYGIYLIHVSLKESLAEAFSFIGKCGGAVFVALLLTAPSWLDLIQVASESVRQRAELSFFMEARNGKVTLERLTTILSMLTVPFFYGNPIGPTLALSANGLFINVFTLFFAFIGIFAGQRGRWAIIAVLFYLLLTFNDALFTFFFYYMGLNLSRASPLGCIIPFIIYVSACGIDALQRQSVRKFFIFAAFFCVSIFSILGIIHGVISGRALSFINIFIFLSIASLLFISLCSCFHYPLLSIALIITIATSAYPLLMRQIPEEIVVNSPFVSTVRSFLPAGSRYAVVGNMIPELHPNFNAVVGIPTIHTYNSLSSRWYSELIRALGGDVYAYGRLNRTIDPDYDATHFWMSNIGLLLSLRKIHHENVTFVGQEGEVRFYQVRSRMGEALQVFVSRPSDKNVELGDLRTLSNRASRKLTTKGDLREYTVQNGQPSMLVLSQQYNKNWKAWAYTGAKRQQIETYMVNGFFQAAYIPSGVDIVRFEYLPWSRFSWIGHLFWGGLAAWYFLFFCKSLGAVSRKSLGSVYTS